MDTKQAQPTNTNQVETIDTVVNQLNQYNYNFDVTPTSDGFRLTLYNVALDTIEALMWFNQKGAICTNHKRVEGEDLVFHQDIWWQIQFRREKEYFELFGSGYVSPALEYVNEYVFRIVGDAHN